MFILKIALARAFRSRAKQIAYGIKYFRPSPVYTRR